MSRFALMLLGTVLSLGIASTASAGNKIWSVPGVINDGLATTISCTNGSTVAASVSVATFQPTGTASGSGTAMIPVNGTTNFVTQAVTALPGATNLGTAPNVTSGSATITAPSGVFCAALLMDPVNDPPKALAPLPVIAKTKQKGV